MNKSINEIMEYIINSFEKFDIDAKISYSYNDKTISYGALFNKVYRKTVNFDEIADTLNTVIKELHKVDNVILPYNRIGDDYIDIKVVMEH